MCLSASKVVMPAARNLIRELPSPRLTHDAVWCLDDVTVAAQPQRRARIGDQQQRLAGGVSRVGGAE